MKPNRTLFAALTFWLAAIHPAFAASTTTVYNSGILVLVFVGFCALVILVQLIPAIITLWGMLMGILSNKESDTVAEAKARK